MEYINEIEERVILVGVQVGDEEIQQEPLPPVRSSRAVRLFIRVRISERER